jgi:hypothetical protein
MFVKNHKLAQIILVFAGIITCLFTIFYDQLRGKSSISFGALQWIGLIAGILLIVVGVFLRSQNFQNFLSKIIRFFIEEIPSIDLPKQKQWVIDLGTILIFLLIAIAFFCGRWKGANPVVDLGSDAANVATYAAVLDHPQNFSNDFLYYSKSNFSYYVSFHLPYLRLASKVFGGYGLAYLSLLIPVIFIQLTGFYTFGKVFYKNRFWAFLLAFLSLIIIYTESSDYWGIYKDPQPRMLFAALLPWLLTLAYQSLSKPKLRYACMVLIGLMLYVHPVSAPGVAFAIWLAFLLLKPDGKKIGTHLAELLGLGLIFVAMAIPFSLIYLNSRDIAPTGVSYETALTTFQSTNLAMFNIKATLLGLFKNLSVTFLLPLALIGWLVSWFMFAKKQEVKLLLFWIFGILLVGVGITLLEPLIDSKMKVLPVLLQLNRDLRYLIPLLEISVLFPLAQLFTSIKATSRLKILVKALVAIIGIALVAVLVTGYKNVTQDVLDMKGYAQQAVRCWGKGILLCPKTHSLDQTQTLEYISEKTATDASFISIPPINMSKVIRYQGLRSISFEIVNVKNFLNVDITKYLEMSAKADEWENIQTIKESRSRFKANLEFASEIGADYAVVSSKDAIEMAAGSYPIVFASGGYAIIDLNQ